MMHLIVREIVLGPSFTIGTAVTFIFAANCVLWAREQWNWPPPRWVQGTFWLFMMSAGVAMRAGWVWGLLWNYRFNANPEGYENFWWVDLIALGLWTAGGLGVIDTYTPRAWNKVKWWGRPWLVTLYMTLLIVGIAHVEDIRRLLQCCGL